MAIDDCDVWTGPVDGHGYGRLQIGRRGENHGYKVHRLVWEEYNGAIPDGMVVRHTCDNPPCINPRHLILGTQLDNVADMMARRRHGNLRKTHCKHGHPYNETNTKVTKRGWRVCLTCFPNGG